MSNETIISKLTSEIKDLNSKIEKLKSFLSNEFNFNVVGKKQWNLMRGQLMAMNDYLETLEKRLVDLVVNCDLTENELLKSKRGDMPPIMVKFLISSYA
jgi:hypothetical protein